MAQRECVLISYLNVLGCLLVICRRSRWNVWRNVCGVQDPKLAEGAFTQSVNESREEEC